MDIRVRICDPFVYYRHSTKEWIVAIDVETDNTSTSINFPHKKLNKAKVKFYKYCLEGLLGEEMIHRFRQHEIHFDVLCNEKGEIINEN